MKTLLFALLITTISCGTEDNKSAEQAASKKPVAKKTVVADEDQEETKSVATYEAPKALDNPITVTVTIPAAVTPPASEDPIIAQKIAEMDTLIQERVNILLAWNVWDDFKTKALVNETPSRQVPANYFQLSDTHPFMKVNGVYGQEDSFMDHYYSWWFGKKVYHCGELVDSTDSELFVEYTGRDTTERSKLYIQVYFYTPVNNGPIYITKIKLNWKFSNGVEQESVKEAKCQ